MVILILFKTFFEVY